MLSSTTVDEFVGERRAYAERYCHRCGSALLVEVWAPGEYSIDTGELVLDYRGVCPRRGRWNRLHEGHGAIAIAPPWPPQPPPL